MRNRANEWGADSPELILAGEKEELARELADYDRRTKIIRKRENTALDSEDDDWDENDLVS
jgi:hypothetical protein